MDPNLIIYMIEITLPKEEQDLFSNLGENSSNIEGIISNILIQRGRDLPSRTADMMWFKDIIRRDARSHLQFDYSNGSLNNSGKESQVQVSLNQEGEGFNSFASDILKSIYETQIGQRISKINGEIRGKNRQLSNSGVDIAELETQLEKIDDDLEEERITERLSKIREKQKKKTKSVKHLEAMKKNLNPNLEDMLISGIDDGESINLTSIFDNGNLQFDQNDRSLMVEHEAIVKNVKTEFEKILEKSITINYKILKEKIRHTPTIKVSKKKDKKRINPYLLVPILATTIITSLQLSRSYHHGLNVREESVINFDVMNSKVVKKPEINSPKNGYGYELFVNVDPMPNMGGNMSIPGLGLREKLKEARRECKNVPPRHSAVYFGEDNMFTFSGECNLVPGTWCISKGNYTGPSDKIMATVYLERSVISNVHVGAQTKIITRNGKVSVRKDIMATTKFCFTGFNPSDGIIDVYLPIPK